MSRWRHVLIATLALLSAGAASAAVDAGELAAARTLLATRRLAEAQQAFERLLQADPSLPEAHFHLGELALRRDDVERATLHLEQAVAAAPGVSRHHRALGDAYGRSAQKASLLRQLGLARKCLAAYQRAVELDLRDPDARQSLFEYYRQAPAIAGGGRDKAFAEATILKQLDPLRGRLALATLYVAEKNHPQAFAEFDEMLRANPDDYAALYHTGRLAALTGHFTDRGIAALRRCLQLTPPARPGVPGHATVHWRLGQLLEAASDPSGARAAYEAALRLDPSLAAATEALRRLPPVKP